LCYHGACLLKVVVAGSTHVRGYGMGRRKGKCVNRSPVVIISCKVLQDILTALLPKDLAQRVTYMDYGLHMLPRRMTTALQEIIEGIEEPSLVVLGYGLCGNGLRGIKAGRHCLLVPRVSDCIALLLGSHETYKKEFGAVPGTYYLSRGWLEAGSHPLSEYEGYVGKYGAERAMWLMDQQYQNYEPPCARGPQPRRTGCLPAPGRGDCPFLRALGLAPRGDTWLGRLCEAAGQPGTAAL
jgi:hypothetical protein